MRVPAVPDTHAGLTPAWLTDALRAGGVIGEARVCDASAERIGEGAGFIGDVARVSLRYEGGAEGLPRTLVAKLPAPDPVRRAMANAARFYEREIRFYEEIAGGLDLRTPRRYFAAMDLDRQAFVLLLEDLASARAGDQAAGCTVADAELAVREIAVLHAAWWEHPRLGALTWMPAQADIHPSAADFWQATWDRGVEQRGGALPPEVLRLGERLGERALAVLAELAGPPHTIVHGDYHLDNLFFAESDPCAPLIVADWQLTVRGRGVFDVAFFLSGNLSPADRRAHETRLLRTWHDALVGRGVQGYSFEQALRDYKLSVAYCLAVVMILSGMPGSGGGERRALLLDVWLSRVAAAIADLQVGELVGGLR